jgi:isopentenyl diphosphate isomerase/L-lactate dehydrogenase-like FMN-dependent dehydrogenase
MSPESLKRSAYSIEAMRKLARRTLPHIVFDFVDGAAEAEHTLRRNEAAFGDIHLLPRPLNGTSIREQSVELFGERLELPVIIGPTGMAGMLWPRGEAAAARAAKAAGTVYTMSHGSTISMEDLAGEVGGRLWMQVFVYRDRALTQSFIERAHAAGYRALVLTIDNQVLGQRERDVRNRFTVPLHMGPRTLLDFALHPRWLLRTALGPQIRFANYVEAGNSDAQSLAARIASLLDPGMSWKDVEWIRRLWDRPLLLKGVLHPDEARRAVGLGVDGLIVSNHGGRQLDGAAASIAALPAVVQAVDARVPVLIDGGVRRGADVVKAIALGARACLIGRPHLWGLSVAGQPGVECVLDCLRAEIDRTMALCGCDRIADIDASLLQGQARIDTAPTREAVRLVS